MPLDGFNITIDYDNATYYQTLRQTAKALGLNPISMEELERHQEEQLKLHPASWAYHHREGIAMTILFTPMAAAAVAGSFTFSQAALFGVVLGIILGGLIGLLFSLLLMVAMIDYIRVRGPAKWKEEPLHHLSAVPNPIKGIAEQLAATIPAHFYLGTLVQDKVVLDPYLLARYRGQTVCLGIWDGDRIIACA